MEILDNFARLLICFHTLCLTSFQSLDPDPVRIFQIQTGFLDLGHNGTSDTKNKYYKTCQLSRKSIYWHFEYLSQLVGPRAPDPYTDQETGFTTMFIAG